MSKKCSINLLILLHILILLVADKGISQETITSPFRRYGTQLYNQKELMNNAAFSEKLTALEDSILDYKLFGTFTPKIVPVVFHVLQSPGAPYISDSTIYRQLNQLNFDFNNSAPGPTPIDPSMAEYETRASIPYIYFCLPDSIGNQKIEENLIRRNVQSAFFPISNLMKSRNGEGSDPILPDQCLNIWICNLPDSIAGFAQYPGGPLSSDGIVISYKYLIPPASELNSIDYNKGKTLTHLVGNYLGVYDLWNETNPCYDDYVYDTPIHNEPNHGFDMIFGHVTCCPGNDLEMIINFMDNTFDSLAYMFTKGQVDRMHSVLSSNLYRGAITSSNVVCNYSFTSLIDSGSTQSTTFIDEFVKVYPNPAKELLIVELSLHDYSPINYTIYDISGKPLLVGKWQENKRNYNKELDLTTLPSGLFYLSIRSKTYFNVIPITIFK